MTKTTMDLQALLGTIEVDPIGWTGIGVT